MTRKEQFVELLRQTGRAGMDGVIAHLEELGFFEAPASTRFHGSCPGGLLEHSLNVYVEAQALYRLQLQMCPALAERLPETSVTIAALLHDICKAEIYKSEIKHRKNAQGHWEDYQGYVADYSAFPMGHGEKSVVELLKWGLELTDQEMLAIRWHMGAFDLAFQSAEAKANIGAAGDRNPLVAILRAADDLAAHVLEADWARPKATPDQT